MRPETTTAALALLLCTATALCQVPEPADGARRVGRAAPTWADAVEITGDGQRRPIDADFERRLIGHRVLLVAPRPGADRDADLRTAAAFAPPARSRSQRERVTLVAATLPGDDRPPTAGTALHVIPDIDARYAAPPRPWVAVHDRRGIVRAVAPLEDADAIRTALGDADGDRSLHRALVGTPMEPLTDLAPRGVAVDDDGTPDLGALRAPPGGLVLYRFWTDGCPHCRASLPPLAELAARFDGFRLVPIYHRKSPIDRSDAWLADYLRDLGHRGPWARDPDWNVLQRLLDRGDLRTATSVSFLVDDRGIVRWVHRGPRVHPDPDREHGTADADFATLERIVTAWCGPAPDPDHVAPAGGRR